MCWVARADLIDNDSVAARLQQGAGTALGFNVLAAGHHDCNRSAVLLVAGGHAYDAFAEPGFVQRFMRETAHLRIDRGTRWKSLRSMAMAAWARPTLALAGLGWGLRLAWRMRAGLLAGRGRVHKLTLFTHNFMDACQLDPERIEACVFMAITQDGPLSMCAFNAQRDTYLLRPLQTSTGTWQPLPPGHDAVPTFPIKWLKGRPRAQDQATPAGGSLCEAGAAMRGFAALWVLLAALMGGCSTLVPAPAAPPSTPQAALDAWARVLDRFVDERGEVDFPALARDRAELDRYVRHVADSPLEQWPDGPQRLAHMINAYNALSMFNVIQSGIPATHAGLNKLRFFLLRKLDIGGRSMSLYSFENDVIRPYCARRAAHPLCAELLGAVVPGAAAHPLRGQHAGRRTRARDARLLRPARELPHRPGHVDGLVEQAARLLPVGLRTGCRRQPAGLRQPLCARAGPAGLHRALHTLRLDRRERPPHAVGPARTTWPLSSKTASAGASGSAAVRIARPGSAIAVNSAQPATGLISRSWRPSWLGRISNPCSQAARSTSRVPMRWVLTSPCKRCRVSRSPPDW